MTFNKRQRFAQDHERQRLAALDAQDGGSRLYEWTEANFGTEYDLEMAARAKVAKAQSKAAELIAALNFVSVAGTKDDAPYKMHVVLNARQAVASDGQLTAGHPIAEDLECCPHMAQLRAALAKTGDSLSIAELPNGQLSITGDKLTAKIPCIAFDALPSPEYTRPDPECAKIDDRIKQAFAVCGVMVSEAGKRAVECGLLLEANACTGTDGKILIQYWHGIDLPPGLFVPKIFAAAACKTKLALTGFGFTAGRSVTFYFENGAWLKTQVYEDAYPPVSQIIEQHSSPVDVPADLFEAIETVAAFDKTGKARLVAGKVTTANADFQVEGLSADCIYDAELTKLIAPFTTQIDLTTYPDRAFFFGEGLRGVIMACGQPTSRDVVGFVEPQGEGFSASYAARQGFEDDIPF